MSSRARIAVFVAAALVAAAGVAVLATAGGGEPPRAPRAPSVVPAAHAAAADDEPAPVATAEAARDGERELAGSSDEGIAEIAGRCVDASSSPIADVQIDAEPSAGSAARSDADGRFALSAPARRSRTRNEIWVVARKLGFATVRTQAFVKPGSTFALGTLTMRPGGVISGRVVDASGAAVPGARVSLASGALATETGADGAYRLDGAPTGEQAVAAIDADGPRVQSKPVEVRAGEETRDVILTVERARDDEVADGVVAGPDGAPYPGARVRARPADVTTRTWQTAVADRAGRFRLRLRGRGGHDLQAIVPEKRLDSPIARSVTPGTHDLALKLRPTRSFALEVRDERGAAVETYSAQRVDLAGFGFPGDRDRVEMPRRAFQAKGRSELLSPGEPFRVRIDALGHWPEEIGPFDPESLPREHAATLRAVPGVRGRVTAAGAPVKGARVFLVGPLAASNAPSGSTVWRAAPNRPNAEELQADADAGGAFFVPLRTSGAYVVRAEFGAYAPAEHGPIEIDAQGGAAGLELAMTPGGAIEGRVLVAGGDDARGRTVVASAADGFSRASPVAADGAFRIEHLAPGRWIAVVVDGEVSSPGWLGTRGEARAYGGAADSKTVIVEEGGVARCDFDLTRLPAVRLVGDFKLDGAPAAGWRAQLSASREGSQAASVDARGAFTLIAKRQGPHELVLSTRLADGTEITLTASLRLVSGDNAWACDLPTGRLEGTVAAVVGDNDPYVSFRWSGAGGIAASAPIRPGRDGTFALSSVPAGRATVVRRRPSDDGTTVVPVEVPAGGVAKIEVP